MSVGRRCADGLTVETTSWENLNKGKGSQTINPDGGKTEKTEKL